MAYAALRTTSPAQKEPPLAATRRLALAVALFASVIVIATLSYVALTDAGWLEAVYMTVISVTTVGYGEIVELDATGRVVTMFVIVLGVGSLALVTVTGIEFLVEGHLQNAIGRRRMERKLASMSDHVIICGFGRVGRQVADQLIEERREVAVIDVNPDRLLLASARGVPYVEGDASHEGVLGQAGIKAARAVVACTADDGENVLIALTAKGAEPDVFVIVRIKDEENEPKARRAGADRVIAPAAIGGRRIAALISRPSVVDFVDVVTHGAGPDLMLEEVEISDQSPLDGATLRDAQVRERYGVNVLGIRRAGETVIVTGPEPGVVLRRGDSLMVIGGRDDLERFNAASLSG